MIEKKVLPGGVRFIYEYIPYVRSASFGVWVGNGSRHEKKREEGASHFIEHMVFKGTRSRTAADIAAISDRIGGQINAYTTKECTCFYGRVLDEHLCELVDVLYDMLKNSKFDDKDIITERNVIFEEIGMYADTPEDLVIEQLFTGIYKGSPLSHPILGSRSSLSKMDGNFLKSYMKSHYFAENIVISLSGSFSDMDIDKICSLFSDYGGGRLKCRPAEYKRCFISKRKNIEQNHICITFPAISAVSPERFALTLLSSAFGGAMSSRLFQTVREELGLCYSIYSFPSSYDDLGCFSIYTALGRETEDRAINAILSEISRVLEHGISEAELTLAKEQAKAAILMSLESTSSRMNRLGRGELVFGQVQSVDETIESYENVTLSDIRRIAERVFDMNELSFSAVGKVKSAEQYRELIQKSI